jgi:hypothetical protein
MEEVQDLSLAWNWERERANGQGDAEEFSARLLRTSTKISRKKIPENRNHMKERSICDFKT